MLYNFIEKSVIMLQKNSIGVMRMEIKRDYYLNKLITKKLKNIMD